MEYFRSFNEQLANLNSFEDVAIGKLVSGGILTAKPSSSLQEVAQNMHKARVSCVLIMEDDQLLGIWTEGDVRRLDFNNPEILNLPVGTYMSAPVITLSATTSLSQASSFMGDRMLRRVVVTSSNQQPIGVLTQSDLVLHSGIESYIKNRSVGASVRRAPLRLPAQMPLAEAVVSLRNARLAAALVVNEAEQTTSIITERDLIGFLAQGKLGFTLGQLVKHPLVCVPQDMGLQEAIDLLNAKGFRHLGVIDENLSLDPINRISGVLSLSDIVTSIEYEYVNRLRAALDSREMALKASTQHLRLAEKVIAASLDGIIITDAQGVIQAVNPSFTTLTGYSPEEAIGQTPALLSSGRQDKDFYQKMWSSLLNKGFWQGEIWNKRKNGEIYIEWLTITAISSDESGIQQFAAIFSDITDRKLKEEQIHSLAFYDELTGLANRRLFMDRLKRALAQAKYHKHKLGVLFLDLDLFKRINDSLGHEAGDQVLQRVAKILKASVRQGDSVARLGGDEFTVLVPELASLHLLEVLANRIISKLSTPLSIMNNNLVVSTSIGISVFPEDGSSVESLIKNADTAMYQAKELGRNSYCFYNQEMGAQSSNSLALENGLRQALVENNLYLVYQPQVDISTGKWVGMETLLRWHDPKLGQVSPADFIPLAEKIGLIEEIGNWVIKQAIKQLSRWLKSQLNPPTVAVNVSARQLQNKYFASNIFQLLNKYQVPPNLLELELTESCLIVGEEDDQYQLLHQLDSQGIKISMDDFGTGYSSLSYIRRLPLSTIKIDVSFVAELPESGEDAQLVKAIISMAKALDMKVVAEGVEKPEQARLLYDLGSSVCQGFGLAKPSDVEVVTGWLESSSNQCWPSLSPEWKVAKTSSPS